MIAATASIASTSIWYPILIKIRLRLCPRKIPPDSMPKPVMVASIRNPITAAFIALIAIAVPCMIAKMTIAVASKCRICTSIPRGAFFISLALRCGCALRQVLPNRGPYQSHPLRNANVVAIRRMIKLLYAMVVPLVVPLVALFFYRSMF